MLFLIIVSTAAPMCTLCIIMLIIINNCILMLAINKIIVHMLSDCEISEIVTVSGAMMHDGVCIELFKPGVTPYFTPCL